MPTIADYLKFANLQMAAEALFDFNAYKDGATLIPGKKYAGVIDRVWLTTGNLHASKFTATEATKFVDPVTGWKVVEHISNTTTGFSGTLFKNNATDELVLSFRSTEFIDDAARDNEATNKLEIAKLGFAFGQLDDMEKWYQSLQTAGKITGPLSVTGYSLGGHLATAFNLMHGQETAAGGQPLVTQVINFNGAGLGKIGDGSRATMQAQLPAMITRFRQLRTQGDTTGLAAQLLTNEGRSTYQALKTALALPVRNGVPDASLVNIVNNMASNGLNEPRTGDNQTDYLLLWNALDRALAVTNKAHSVGQLTSGSTAVPPNPATIPDHAPNGSLAIAAESLDYQLAVLITARELNTQPLSISAGISAALGNPTPALGGRLTNQWDVAATETTTPPWYMVAYSQYRYGQDVKLFIEDQPFKRGNAVSETLKSLMAGKIELLHDQYANNDFGDTHSLALIVDSLNVQNTLLQLLPVGQRTDATKTLDTILKNASWRKAEINSAQGQAEGDVLENVVNALADLILGPQGKAQRLNGSPDGNTWWSTTNTAVGDTTYTGRDTFYAKLKAITDKIAEKSLTGKLSLAPSTAGLQDSARSDYFVYTALASLSPVVFTPATAMDDTAMTAAFGTLDSYQVWQADKLAVDRRETPVSITDQWIADRAAFLDRKNWYNKKNINPLDPAYVHNSTPNPYQNDDVSYWDVASDYKIAQGMVGDATRRFYFGDEQDNTLAGGGVDDHLYGGGGNDSLTGNYDNDYLEGNDGNDTLDGGVGADTLVAGKGADSLIGGAGFDTYVVAQLSGTADDPDIDTLTDADGKGILKDSTGRLIAGSFVPKEGGGYVMLGNSEITASGDGALAIRLQDGAKVVLQNFGEVAGGELGIHRHDIASGGTIIRGDLGPILDSNGNLQYDSRDNVIVSVTEAPGREDRLFGSDAADTLLGLGGRDFINGKGGNDLIEGSDGSDIVSGGIGNDMIYGLSGSAGNAPLAIALASGNSDLSQDARGDWVDGGAGDDILVGTAAKDLLTGGADHDLMIGGAGNDLLLGDVSLVAGELNWSVTRIVTKDAQTNVATYRWSVPSGNTTGSDSAGGADVLYGGKGDDWAYAGAGDDLVDGGGDADVLFGDAGNDILFGGAGEDVISGDDADLTKDLHGNDWIDGGNENDTIYGNGGDDTIIGGRGVDTIRGGAGRDTYVFNKDDGVDRIYDDDSGPEKSILIFGAGFDKDSIKLRTGSLLLDLGNGDAIHIENWDQANPLANQTFESFQFADGSSLTWEALLARGFDLDGTDNDDEIIGTGVEDRIDGKGGNDLISGLDGNDVIIGGTGTDAMNGGLGDDRYIVRIGDAAPVEGIMDAIEGIADDGGSDTLRLEGRHRVEVRYSVDDSGETLIVRAGSDQLGILGQDEGTIDFIEFDPASGSGQTGEGGNTVERVAVDTLDITGHTVFDAQAAASLTGTFANDSLTATGSEATLNGGRGADSLTAMGDRATLAGGRGKDTITASGANNVILYATGDGTDQVSLTNGVSNILKLSGVTPAELKLRLGSQGEMALQVGDEASDVLNFTGFNQQNVLASQPFDHIDFDPSTGSGQAGSTLSYADLLARGFDLAGTDQADSITGTSVGDRIEAGAGDDVLLGGGGDDTLSGGAGRDVYQLRLGDGVDTVIDGGAETNVLRFEAWQTDKDIRTTREGDDLKLIVKGTADGFTLKDYYAGDAQSWQLEFGGLDGVTLESVLARPDEQSSAIDAFWSSRKADVINGMIRWNSVVLGNQYMGDLVFQSSWTGPYLTATKEQTTSLYYDIELFSQMGSTSTHLDWDGRIEWSPARRDREVIHFGINQIQSNATLIESVAGARYETSERSAILTIKLQAEKHDFSRSYKSTTGIYTDTLGQAGGIRYGLISPPPILTEITIVEVTDSYNRYATVVGSTDHTTGWTAPVNAVVGNQVAVSYTQNDVYQPFISEITAGASDNEIHAYSNAVEFVDAGLGDDTIHGAVGDLLYGNAGDDVIYGNSSLLIGGDGSDTLRGGEGGDYFVSLSANETGTDIVDDAYGNADEFKSWYYEAQGITDYQSVGEKWELWGGEASFNSLQSVEEFFAAQYPDWPIDEALASGDLVYVAPTAIAPLLLGDSKDFRLVESFILNRLLQRDVVQLPPGIGPNDITLSWGTVDDGNGKIRATLDMSWNGAERLRIVMPRADDPIGWGVDQVIFDAVGGMGLGDLVALAPPMPDLGDGTQLGNREDNWLVARDGGEHLFGLGGNDILIGGSGNDALDGGAGNDSLSGRQGNDVYVFGRGDGQDLVLDHDATTGNIDTVFFAPGITPDQVSASRAGTNLVLVINGSEDRLTVSRWFEDASHKIEQVIFFDGTRWNAEALLAMLPNGPDVLSDDSDSFVGSAGADVIEGRAGDDALQGQAGDDFIKGGAGNDVLSGGSGNDVYYFDRGDGQDVVNQNDAAQDDFDILRFGEGIAPGDIVFSKVGIGNDQVLALANTTDSVTLRDVWEVTAMSAVEFADGTVWDRDTLMSKVDAPSDDVLAGTDADDFIYGNLGKDVYLIGPGGGHDVVYEGESGPVSGNEADTIRFTAGIAPADVEILSGEGDSLLKLSIAGGIGSVDLMFWPETLPRIEFADGTVWSPAVLQAALEGSVSDFESYQRLIGSIDDEVLAATTAIYTEIHGMAGNDTLIAGEGGGWLIGGTGDDTLIGGAAWNNYFIDRHSGHDTVIATVGSEISNVLELGAGVSPDQLRFARHAGADGLDLVIAIDGSAATATIQGWYDPVNPSRLDSLYFWDADSELFGAELDAAIQADNAASGSVTLSGTAAQNQILTASSTLADLDGMDAIRYQWQSSIDGDAWNVISGATADSFALTEAEVGQQLRVVVSYVDREGITGSVASAATAAVVNINDAPFVVQAIGDQRAVERTAFSLTLAADSFADVDAGDSLVYAATLADGSALPSWLSFDAATCSFSGTPPSEAVGSLNLTLTATDLAGASAAGSFTLNVASSNQAPVLVVAIGDQSATQDRAFSYAVPAGSFADSDPGDSLSFTATLADGTALPGWLAFDAATRTFSGTPGAGSPGVLALRVTATDGGGLSADAAFTLSVGQHLRGTASSDTLNYSASSFVGVAMMDGGAGNDAITGSAGNDIIVGGAGSDNLNGSGGDDTFLITGTDTGYDRFEGGAGYDVMQGGTGDDTFRMYQYTGAATVERIDGNGGNDIIAGTGSSDTLDFSATELVGIALIDGGAGNDAVTGSAGNDFIVGGAGSDNLNGGAGDDAFLITGTDAGYDRFEGGAGYDVMQGGAGDDTFRMYQYTGAATVERIEGGGGTDIIAGTGSSDTLDFSATELVGIALIDGGAGNDAITGSTGNDFIVGGAGSDNLNGGAGDDAFLITGTDAGYDRFEGGAGYDVMQGGTGDDTFRMYQYTGAATVEKIDGNGGNDVIAGTGSSDTLDFSATELVGIALIDGGAGNDAITGSAGNDFIVGGAGSDNLNGSGGDDTFLITGTDAGYDRFEGGAGYDVMQGGTGDDTFRMYQYTGAATVERIDGNGGNDVIAGTGSSDTLDFSATELVGIALIYAGAGNDAVTGSAGDDIIVGGAGSDNLNGGAGDDLFRVSGIDYGYDRFEGGAGFDLVLGDSGDDTFRMYQYTGAATVEKIEGGGGTDVIAGTGSSDTLDFSATELIGIAMIDGGLGNDAIIGSGGDDVILGGAGSDNLNGGAGDDIFMVSGTDAGYDRFEGGAGFDLVMGGDGDDTFRMYQYTGAATVEKIEGGGGTDVIAGTASSDTLDFSTTLVTGIALIDGGAGNDAITGSAGDDIIVGGAGSDNLNGGGGNDVFSVSGTDSGYDRFEGGAGLDVLRGGNGDDTFRMYQYTGAATVEKIEGSGGIDVIAGTGSSDTLDFSATELVGIALIDGGAGNDAITGSAGNDFIAGGTGTDRLAGGLGDDRYRLGRGDGADTIVENDASAGNTDAAEFLAGIAAEQIWLRHVGNNLEAGILGTGDKLTVQNWYLGEQYRVEQFRTADGRLLLDSQVENLVQAMAAFAPPGAGQTSLPPAYQEALAPVIAANWQ